MNDPQEGKLLADYLEKKVDTSGNGDKRNEYKENYVFLKSFFCYPRKNREANAKEFLPMWVRYGDDAKGCCVMLNSKTFEKSSLRKIVYLTDDGKCENKKIEDLMRMFKATYGKLANLCEEQIEAESYDGKNCLQKINALTGYIISQISYLFKSDSYKHENEVRLILNKTEAELDQINELPNIIPKLYVYNDEQTYIDEIILGSKMENPEDYIPFICKHGHKMWKEYEGSQIKVTHSAIQYR